MMDAIHAKPEPILKWLGGKRKLISEIESRFPFDTNDEFDYVEPFFGGGAICFWMLNNYPNVRTVVINDLNTDMMNMYKSVQDAVEDVIENLEPLQNEFHALFGDKQRAKEYYLAKRVLYNSRTASKPMHAALFIFLNKTGYNGMYRVNKDNGMNIGMGTYNQKPNICNVHNLLAVSNALQRVTILNCDFKSTLCYAKGHETFFYLDPPYKPLDQKPFLNAYTADPFKDAEQIRLKKLCDDLHSSGSKWILSNSDLKNTDPEDNFFDDLYANYKIDRVQTNRSVNSDASKRGKVFELMIQNYETKEVNQLVA